MNNRKVVITGMDMITALGLNLKTTWENMLLGKSGTKIITIFDPVEHDTKIAAEVSKDFEEYAKEIIPRRMRQQMTRVTQMGYISAVKAIEDSKINFDDYDRDRCAVILGVVSTGYNSNEKSSRKHLIVKQMTNAPSAWISMNFNLNGPAYPVATACASAAYAIQIGYDMIKNNTADVVVVGGTDSHIDPDMIEGFNQLCALSIRNDSPETASRPFSASRDGFVMGEGAGTLILESEEYAKKRNAKIYCELAGGFTYSEAFNIVGPQTDGIGMEKTMSIALANAGVDKDSVDYINAHGTSTYHNDRYEVFAIKKLFGDRAKDISISSSKSMFGHTIGAAGAVEGIATAMSIFTNKITPTINYQDVDPELDLNFTPNKSIDKKIRAAISNSFGFGGHNASLIFKSNS